MNRVSAAVTPLSRTTASRLTASWYSFSLARSWPPSASPNSLDHSIQVYLSTRTITASTFAPSRSPSASPNSLDYSLQVYLQTCSITGSECISKFTRSRCAETVELEGSQPFIKTLPHLAGYLKAIHEKERFQLEESRKRVRRYEGIPGHDDKPHKLRGSLKLGMSA